MCFSDILYFMRLLPLQSLSVVAVPAFKDNYLWLIHNGRDAIVIDPGDASIIVRELEKNHLKLCAILLTHHHNDHTGGVIELYKRYQCPVYGPPNEGIAGITKYVSEDDHIVIDALDLNFVVIDVPGHTLGHIAFYAEKYRYLFCGDSLFTGGCGRLFEGTPKQMYESLNKLSRLPDDTKVYCAHEYTLDNLTFALHIDPSNTALIKRMHIEKIKRAHKLPTIPSNIKLEKLSNPFLRTNCLKIISHLLVTQRIKQAASPVEIFAAIRNWKNHFK